jgi:DNA polymerase epsilon subunit 2
MSNSVPTVGLFTENCIIIAEGFLRADRVFEVVCLGFPHLESRIDFRCAPLALSLPGVAASDTRRLTALKTPSAS